MDARSDLLSFGCVLYEMPTGKRAFDGAPVFFSGREGLELSPNGAILRHAQAPHGLRPWRISGVLTFFVVWAH